MTVTVRSSTLPSDPALLREELARGHAVELTDLDGALVVRPEDIHALADQLAEEEELENMASLDSEDTGVENVIFVSPKGRARHAARIKIAINPSGSFSPAAESASMAMHDYSTVGAPVPPPIAAQAKRFIDANRAVLMDYWDEKIGTKEMIARLKKI